jgi:hypothetical protein
MKRRARRETAPEAQASPYRPTPAQQAVPPDVVRAWGRPTTVTALIALSGLYFASIFFDGAAKGLPARLLPRPLAYFTQTTALFTHAATMAIEYRAEGFRCDGDRWTEIDVRAFFPMDADDKESRFQRVMHFYRENRPTMQALEEYVMGRYNRAALAAASAGRGGDAEPIAGVRFLSLRIPFGAPGGGAERYERKPLSSYPEDIRKPWYFTPASKREDRCKKSAP